MFTRNRQNEPSLLDKAIADATLQLDYVPAYSEEYDKIVDRIERMYKLKEGNLPQRVSPDTLAVVLGNLLGIVVIVGYEQRHVVTSKALNFVMKAAT